MTMTMLMRFIIPNLLLCTTSLALTQPKSSNLDSSYYVAPDSLPAPRDIPGKAIPVTLTRYLDNVVKANEDVRINYYSAIYIYIWQSSS